MTTAPQQTESDPRQAKLSSLPAQGWRQLRRASRTTPGRLSVLLTGLVLLCLLFGLVAALMVQQKQNTLDDLADRREPVAIASQEIYRSLSDADATASSSFLSGDGDSARLRDRYLNDIAKVGSALSVAATNSNLSALSGNPISVLTTKLPIYTGLIETANANNRQVYPVGAAYLREATGLMRTELLPAAERLREADKAALNDQQEEATSFPWFSTLLLLVLVAALIYTQRYVRKRTNRVLNVGLVVASAAIGLSVLWSLVALIFSAVHAGGGRDEGSVPVQAYVEARIAAVKARGDETLLLVSRSDSDQYQKEFDTVAKTFGGRDGSGGMMGLANQLSQGQRAEPEVQAALRNARQWLAAHGKTRELYESGQYDRAVLRTVGAAQNGGGAAYYRLDDNLSKAIDLGRTEFANGTTAAANALFGLSIGIVVLSIVAASGAAVGVWQRLREYR